MNVRKTPFLEDDLRRLDGDAALLLVLAGVGEAGLTGLGTGDDTGLGHERIGQRRLAVVDVRDDGHVADVPLLVHHGTDFVDGKVNLGYGAGREREKGEKSINVRLESAFLLVGLRGARGRRRLWKNQFHLDVCWNRFLLNNYFHKSWNNKTTAGCPFTRHPRRRSLLRHDFLSPTPESHPLLLPRE